MSLAESERAVRVRAEERTRARNLIASLDASGERLVQVLGENVIATDVDLDDRDSVAAAEIATAQTIDKGIVALDTRIAELRSELEAAKKARINTILILIGMIGLGILVLTQIFQ